MLVSDSLWFKDAIIYELHVRAFFDSLGDGAGDFRGLTQKLDYLQDLGVTALWLLPFYPSPLRDDGYDIADYGEIHPDYGTLEAFKEFLDEAHKRNLQVITELVINHTSDQHPWFRRARRAPPGSPERDFYVWSDSPEKYRGVRIIFKDYEVSNWSYDNVAKSYYWHRFYSHQPDLNYDNPAVWEAIFPVVDFWFKLGVDGMRLDAVPYLYEREGTNCENLPETHDFLKALRKHIDERFPNRMLLAEANQWPEDAVTYFGDGDECHMCFHFPLMPRLFMGIHREDRFPIIDILEQTPPLPENCQWAVFLRNHDELTLEMVTDEERDYMYRAYAQDLKARINLGIRRRLAPLLGNNRRRMELMNGLLFSLPGTPVLYYGDEIGMGDNIYLGDRNGVRTPMQWSADRNAGFSRSNPQRLYLPIIIDPEYHYESVNVEAQQNNPHSLLRWTKRLIDLRKRYKAFSRGRVEMLDPSNRKILAFLRRYEEETLLVVANLSRFVQYVELDLSHFNGTQPIELFGNTPFPKIGELPYLLTLGPHSFYWFRLSEAAVEVGARPSRRPPQQVRVRAGEDWKSLLSLDLDELEGVLPQYLHHRRWVEGPMRTITRAQVSDFITIESGDTEVIMLFVDADASGESISCVLPVIFAAGDMAARIEHNHPEAVVATVAGTITGLIYDATIDPLFGIEILKRLRRAERLDGSLGGELRFEPAADLERYLIDTQEPLHAIHVQLDQMNDSFDIANRLVMKLYRKIQTGPHPEVELGRFLTETDRFPHAANVAGTVTFRRPRVEPVTVAIVHEHVTHQADAWQFTLDSLATFFDEALSSAAPPLPPGHISQWLHDGDSLSERCISEFDEEYLEFAQLLGRRTAEMHRALASDSEHAEFAPEPFTPHYQRSVYQGIRSLKREAFDRLTRQSFLLAPEVREASQQLLKLDDRLMEALKGLLDRQIEAPRIRIHGDYHLGQVLCTGKDLVVIDFEGPATSSLGERRIKRSPLRDVASMLRSFDYAARSSLMGLASGRGRPVGTIRQEDRSRLESWAEVWYACVARRFWQAYLETARDADLFPGNKPDTFALLFAFLLEKALSELLQELAFRPHWVAVPIEGLLELLASGADQPR